VKRIIALLCVTALTLSCLTGCFGIGESEENSVNVQSVAMICGIEDQGLLDRFAGIVSSRGEYSYYANQEKTIKEFLVKEGDEVHAGDVLFTYDVELAALELEKAELELQQMNVNLEARKQAKANLEKEKEKAKAEEQLSYTLEIQQIDAEIREAEYNITLKQKDVAHLYEGIAEGELCCDADGRVSSVKENPGYDNYGNREASVKLIESGAYRVKGYVNEVNASALTEGVSVLIRSRVDDRVWKGYISMIDWANPKSENNNNYYYYGETNEMTSTTEYPFYVELDDSEGLLLGQHVYIEPDYGQTDEHEDALMLNSFYLFDIDGSSANVWAEKDGKLEKRKITLGSYYEELDTYEIIDGLTADDYIAVPEEGLKEGQPCIEYDDSMFNDGEDDGNFPAYDGGDYYEEDSIDLDSPMPETAAPAPMPINVDVAAPAVY